MDNPGWHAQRRAQKENEAYNREYRNSGYHVPVEELGPMDESFIGGFKTQPPPSPRPPVPPPKDFPAPVNAQLYQTQNSRSTISTAQLAHMSAVERSQILRVVRMDPHLQFMCGPLLRYDTTDEHGIWHGAALVITADSGSIYEPHPTLTYTWDPEQPVPPRHHRQTSLSMSNTANPPFPNPTPTSSQFSSSPTEMNGDSFADHGRPSGLSQLHSAKSYELGPHPADPHSTFLAVSPTMGSFGFNPNMPIPNTTSNSNGYRNGTNGDRVSEHGSDHLCSERVPGQEIWVYGGHGGTFTFWRFLIKVPLAQHEMSIKYSINRGQQLEFWVPGRAQNMRWAAHSCNGFSAGVNPDDFRGPGFKSGYDPVWMDLLSKHSETPFHALIGGGDQLYCDVLMREPEMQEWVSKSKPEEKKAFQLSEEIELAIDRFFFNHYCQAFRSGAFARANSSIPMVNMCDDHGMIDGFGSYPDDLQMAPVFRHIGARGYFFFLLFQCFINVGIDGVQDTPGRHVFQSLVVGQMGPYVRLPSHSFLPRLGPKVYMLMLDCRAERKKDQVCSPGQYRHIFDRLNSLPAGVEHLIVQLGIPIAYPRMVFLETALDSKFNPLVALGKSGSLGLSGFVNKFNAEAELLDDLNDHWTARSHKRERNWLIEQLQNFALVKRIRVTFLSGDVHCAAVGVLKTLKTKNRPEVAPRADHRYMVNVVTSAIVNTPPPGGVITMVSSLASKVHKTLHSVDTDETMVPIFTKEPTGQPRKQKYIMGKRNWCRVEFDERNGEITFDIRVEREKGGGVTTGYPMIVPPPGW
ncbi:hypothetical protein GALMADRAFT_239986 [Galerina marginata CBS 339.88]|uniref:PhoD-like phosphatase domain-containing protein n=1 Tax=Galerina marginata (strain CBS 339.88) TaxID=685588 RepID=A0A067TPE6_GALM3|nr:hypothetical protein GALMADRAFT_239986 [Galerina marginata CBS 339.88]